MPVILAVYDGQEDKAYWIHVQEYLDEKNVAGDDFTADQDRVTVRIPIKNRLDMAAVDLFRQFRIQQMKLSQRNRHHGK